MLVAICDDNVADRKQTERLMGREADKWIKAGDPVYVYSYGSAVSLLANFMQYDAMILDFSKSKETTINDFIQKAHEAGGTGCFVICNTNGEEISEDYLELPKPITVDRLHEVLVKVKEIRESMDTSKIEIRADQSTIYCEEEDILYAVADAFGTRIHLKDGRTPKVNETIDTFFENIQVKHETFVMPNFTSIVNIRYIEKIKFNKATMCDGTRFPASGGTGKYMKMVMEKIKMGEL